MGFNINLEDDFKINIIKNIYNSSKCLDVINKTVKKIKCQDFSYNKYKDCCNGYIKKYINNYTSLEKCYNNSDIYYKYNCEEIRNYDILISIFVFLVLICLCVGCLLCRRRNYELEEKKRLISYS